jgi:hypothetical protein
MSIGRSAHLIDPSCRAQVDNDQISGKRRVQVSSFKNTTMVGIREYYEKDGEMLPGKKVCLAFPV